MLIVSKGTVVHDGKEYGAGEVLPDMEKAESDRLIKLGACQYIPSAEKSPQLEEDDGGQQAEQKEDGEPEGLHLNVDPDETIKSGK